MKYTIEGFDQQQLVNWNLDTNDALILRWLVDFFDENESFYDYDKIVNDLPILNINKQSIQKRIKRYISAELLKDDKFHIVELLKNKNLHAKGIGSKICEWCGINTVCLHSHHYPILKSDNGTKTVNICPNCHSEFHNFINITPTKNLIDIDKGENFDHYYQIK